jgi:hypothetical protein
MYVLDDNLGHTIHIPPSGHFYYVAGNIATHHRKKGSAVLKACRFCGKTAEAKHINSDNFRMKWVRGQ